MSKVPRPTKVGGGGTLGRVGERPGGPPAAGDHWGNVDRSKLPPRPAMRRHCIDDDDDDGGGGGSGGQPAASNHWGTFDRSKLPPRPAMRAHYSDDEEDDDDGGGRKETLGGSSVRRPGGGPGRPPVSDSH
jgi:hypothetical protein